MMRLETERVPLNSSKSMPDVNVSIMLIGSAMSRSDFVHVPKKAGGPHAAARVRFELDPTSFHIDVPAGIDYAQVIDHDLALG